jgi:hypothetical protein
VTGFALTTSSLETALTAKGLVNALDSWELTVRDGTEIALVMDCTDDTVPARSLDGGCAIPEVIVVAAGTVGISDMGAERMGCDGALMV